MDWLEFLQIICVPAFVWLVHKVGNVHKELNDFKVQVAREYATQLHINRLELKIDELRQLIWEIHNESKTTKGNIRHGANWQGLNPDGRNIDSAFCVFTAPIYGIRALAKILINYKRIHGLKTVRQIISRYAPPSENQTIAYIQSVAKQLGVYPDTVIDIEERGVLTVFIKAVIRMERHSAIFRRDTSAGN